MSTNERYLEYPGASGEPSKFFDTLTGEFVTDPESDETGPQSNEKEESDRSPFGTVVKREDSPAVKPDEPKPAPHKQDKVEELRNEADRATSTPQYPVGAPELTSIIRLPFKERAQAMRLYQAAMEELTKVPANGTALDTPDKLERYFNALSAFDDFLVTVAVNKRSYIQWVKQNDDEAFGALFLAYVTRFGLGEASSSSS